MHRQVATGGGAKYRRILFGRHGHFRTALLAWYGSQRRMLYTYHLSGPKGTLTRNKFASLKCTI